MRQAKFTVFEGDDGQWYWRLKSANGRTLCQGEAHTRKRDADRAIETVTETIQKIAAKAIVQRFNKPVIDNFTHLRGIL